MLKPSPRYWWDFTTDTAYIIVQSDYPVGEELARFTANSSGLSSAEKLINDFESGRKTPNWSKNANSKT